MKRRILMAAMSLTAATTSTYAQHRDPRGSTAPHHPAPVAHHAAPVHHTPAVHPVPQHHNMPAVHPVTAQHHTPIIHPAPTHHHTPVIHPVKPVLPSPVVDKRPPTFIPSNVAGLGKPHHPHHPHRFDFIPPLFVPGVIVERPVVVFVPGQLVVSPAVVDLGGQVATNPGVIVPPVETQGAAPPVQTTAPVTTTGQTTEPVTTTGQTTAPVTTTEQSGTESGATKEAEAEMKYALQLTTTPRPTVTKLKAGDVIISLGGMATESPEALAEAATKFAGQNVKVEALDGKTGKEKSETVTVANDGTLAVAVQVVRIK